jgi:hypothetical protein
MYKYLKKVIYRKTDYKNLFVVSILKVSDEFRRIRILSPYLITFKEPRNRFQGMNSASLCSLAGRYDKPIPTRCLAPIDCLKFQLGSIN